MDTAPRSVWKMLVLTPYLQCHIKTPTTKGEDTTRRASIEDMTGTPMVIPGSTDMRIGSYLDHVPSVKLLKSTSVGLETMEPWLSFLPSLGGASPFDLAGAICRGHASVGQQRPEESQKNTRGVIADGIQVVWRSKAFHEA